MRAAEQYFPVVTFVFQNLTKINMIGDLIFLKKKHVLFLPFPLKRQI